MKSMTRGIYIWASDMQDETTIKHLELFHDAGKLDIVIPVIPAPNSKFLYNSKAWQTTFAQTDGKWLEPFCNWAHKRDINVRLCVVTFSENSGKQVSEFCVKDVKGNPLSSKNYFGSKWKFSSCPSNPRVRRFLKEEMDFLARKYDIDGFTITHNRYSPPSHGILNLFSCCCNNCSNEISGLGYDFSEIKRELNKMLRRLHSLDPKIFKKLGGNEMNFFDALYYMGHEREYWLMI